MGYMFMGGRNSGKSLIMKEFIKNHQTNPGGKIIMKERDYELNDSAKKALEKTYEQLERNFYSVWTILLSDNERDEIMYHILEAKLKLYKMLKKGGNSK